MENVRSNYSHLTSIAALQVGVKVIIAVSLVLVMFVIFYAILYQMCKKKRCSRKKDLS